MSQKSDANLKEKVQAIKDIKQVKRSISKHKTKDLDVIKEE